MAAAINLCETKQELLRIVKKYSHCDKVVYYELLSDGVCPTCSLEIFKLEKKYQIAERYLVFSVYAINSLQDELH